MSDPSNPKQLDTISLRSLTSARVGLNRTGVSLTTRHALEFAVAHAQARDAVHSALAIPSLLAALRERNLDVVHVKSAARERTEFLRRPDLGRTLSDSSVASLTTHPGGPFTQSHRVGGVAAPDTSTLSIILADGLSALAVERHALPVLDALLPLLQASDPAWQLAPIVIAEESRVALGDQIGQALAASVTVMLIGERPGLSSPASLGAYITWSPRPGRTDAERNCVSNIRTEGLDYATAATRIAWFVNEGRRLKLTGVALHEPHPGLPR